jgi:hypothetical protein
MCPLSSLCSSRLWLFYSVHVTGCRLVVAHTQRYMVDTRRHRIHMCRPYAPSGSPRITPGCNSVLPLGRGSSAHGSRMGVRGPGRQGPTALSMGQSPRGGWTAPSQHMARVVSEAQHSGGRVCMDGTSGCVLAAKCVRTAQHGGQRVGMDKHAVVRRSTTGIGSRLSETVISAVTTSGRG